jgi:hypothetical protein
MVRIGRNNCSYNVRGALPLVVFATLDVMLKCTADTAEGNFVIIIKPRGVRVNMRCIISMSRQNNDNTDIFTHPNFSYPIAN